MPRSASSSFRFQTRAGILAVALSAAAALAHNHITVDTASGSPGDRIIVRAGYLPADAGLSVRAGRLLQGIGRMTYPVRDQLDQAGGLDGWFAGDEMLLTSDFYFGTGRLAGGDFRWEIRSVVDVYSGTTGRMVWGQFAGNGSFAALADSAAPARTGRSFDTFAGSHQHAQAYAFAAPGTYDVTMVVWDGNGRYADSVPVTIRFVVGPVPTRWTGSGL